MTFKAESKLKILKIKDYCTKKVEIDSFPNDKSRKLRKNHF